MPTGFSQGGKVPMGFVRNPVGFGGEGPLMKGRVPSMESAPGAGCLSLLARSAFDEARPGSGYLPRLMLSAYASRNRLWRHPLPGLSEGDGCALVGGGAFDGERPLSQVPSSVGEKCLR